jgi:ABC-type transport system involved in multi-copper enzyme maturation permease subunit
MIVIPRYVTPLFIIHPHLLFSFIYYASLLLSLICRSLCCIDLESTYISTQESSFIVPYGLWIMVRLDFPY